jgi:putative nucleotidyltransferase with HDIG domain
MGAQTLNVAQIKHAIYNHIPLAIKSYHLSHSTEEYIEQVISQVLIELGQDKIVNPITYCLKELAVNAKKANTKRVYFQEKNLDLNNPADYKKGMETFKQETLDNINYFLDKQKEMGLYVKITIKPLADKLILAVHNNVKITQKEHMRIYDRVAASRAYNSMEHAFSELMDSSEGAGLGIIILVLTLKSIGLDEEAFEVETSDIETVAKITIPLSKIHLSRIDQLSNRIVQEVHMLPQFPENLVSLQKLIMDPESNINEIARQVSRDPSLTADLLKQVNSALYMLPNKIDNIGEAVKLVGLRGLRNLIYKYGSQKILRQKYAEMKALWNHSNMVANYAYFLAKNLRKKKDVWDDAFIAGILHDLGKIVINSLHPDILEKIRNFCIEKEIPEKMIENLSIGINHAEIGALIAQKWNFPDTLIQSINCHHDPSSCAPSYKDIVYIVYLANALYYYKDNKFDYEQFNPDILKYLGIESEAQLQGILMGLQKNVELETV